MQPLSQAREQPRLAVSRSNIDQHAGSRLRRARGGRPAGRGARRGAPRRGVRAARDLRRRRACAAAREAEAHKIGAAAPTWRGRAARSGAGAGPGRGGRPPALWPAPWRRSSCASSSPTRWRRRGRAALRRRGAVAVPRRGKAVLFYAGCRPAAGRSRRRPRRVRRRAADARPGGWPAGRGRGRRAGFACFCLGAWRWGAYLRRETVADRAVAWLGRAARGGPAVCFNRVRARGAAAGPAGPGRGRRAGRGRRVLFMALAYAAVAVLGAGGAPTAPSADALLATGRVRPGRRVLPLRVAAGGDPHHLAAPTARSRRTSSRRTRAAPTRGGGGGVGPRRRRARVEPFVSIVDWTSLLLLGFTNSLPLVWTWPGAPRAGGRACLAALRRLSRALASLTVAGRGLVCREAGARGPSSRPSRRGRGEPPPAGRMRGRTPCTRRVTLRRVFFFRPRPLPRGLSSGSCASSPAR